MATTIPPNYPDGCTDDQIQQTIRSIQSDLNIKRFDINSVLQFSPLLNIGLSELDRRASAGALRQAKILTFLSVGIAVVALLVASYGSISSARWEKQQLESLNRIDANTNLSEVFASQSSLLENIEARLKSEVICVLKSDSIEGLKEKEGTD